MTTFALHRGPKITDGVYGILTGDNGFSCVTLERTWEGVPKIPVGTYTCELGIFTLKNSYPSPYYQVMHVPNHTDILIHPANYVDELQGCIGVGEYVGREMLRGSKYAFEGFMHSLSKEISFTLIVS